MSPSPLQAASPADFLILPPSVSRNRGAGTRVNKCMCCGSEFPLDQPEKFARHVRQCSERNAEVMEAVVDRHEKNELANPSDRELYDHIRAGGN